MSETKKTCQVQMHDSNSCGRDLYDEEFCICHSKREEKDLHQFLGVLFQILGNDLIKEYDLTGFIFPKGVDFIKTFSKPTLFNKAIFRGETNFSGAVFKEWVDFQSAQFEGETDFRGVVFEHDVCFWNVTFKEKTFFMLSIFKGEADFELASFEGAVYFVDTEFGDFSDFSMSTFRRLADLWNVVFKGESTFEGTSFMGTANFMGSIFEAGLLINADNQHKISFHEEVDFTSVKFLKPQQVEFQKIDLSLVRFLETDIRGVHFIDVNWNKEKGKGRNQVFDEVSPNPDNNKYDYALIAQLYRQLRANYEENLQYSEAGDFYIGEMEMTRKAEKKICKKLPLFFYKAISKYGESYYRPLCWILAILLLFPIFFIIAGIQPVNHEQIIVAAEKIKDYSTSFWYSTSIFSFIRDKKCTTTNNWGDALFVTESILSPIMLAFLLLALRRRFKR